MEPTEEEKSAARDHYETLSVDELETESVRIKQEEGTNSRWKRLLIKEVREHKLLHDELSRRLGFDVGKLPPEALRALIEESKRSSRPGDVVVTPDTATLEHSSDSPEILSDPSSTSGDAS